MIIRGGRVHNEIGGEFIKLTIFEDVSNNMRVAQDEIFGPILFALSFETEEDAI